MKTLPAIMDIEASGFGAGSYPIEVGYITEEGDKFCCLIKPHVSWKHWDDEAEELHGISRHMLKESGRDIAWVARELNRRLGNKTLYSDGWVVDSAWINELFYRAAVTPMFRLSSLEMILSEAQMSQWHTVKDKLHAESVEGRHRASVDAQIIQTTYQLTRI